MVVIDQWILLEIRTADVSKMCLHPLAGEGLLWWLILVSGSLGASWNPGGMGLPCRVAGQVFGPKRCGTAEAEVKNIQRHLLCQQRFLAHPSGSPTLRIR